MQGALPLVNAESQVDLFNQFLKLFPMRLNSSIKRLDSSTWRVMSQFHYLSDEEIRRSIVDQSPYIRACSFDVQTSFAVVVLPAASRYNNAEQFQRLKKALTGFGLEPRPYKAAGSDDIHIYVFFDQLHETAEISRRVSSLLMHAGFENCPETLVASLINQQLPLPLQPGFAWLNDHLQVRVSRDEISFESALAMFLSDVSRYARPFSLEQKQPLPAVSAVEVPAQNEDGAESISYSVEVVEQELVDSDRVVVPLDLEEPTLALDPTQVVHSSLDNLSNQSDLSLDLPAENDSLSDSDLDPVPRLESAAVEPELKVVVQSDHVTASGGDDQVDYSPAAGYFPEQLDTPAQQLTSVAEVPDNPQAAQLLLFPLPTSLVGLPSSSSERRRQRRNRPREGIDAANRAPPPDT